MRARKVGRGGVAGGEGGGGGEEWQKIGGWW